MNSANNNIQHVFICGSKSIGQYGGFETFVNKLSGYFQNDSGIKLHIACKANGNGCMDESLLTGVMDIVEQNGEVNEFTYHNAHCFKIKVPNKIGPAQAVLYDVAALKYSINYCKKNGIRHPFFYVLACRIGPFMHYFKRQIERIGGILFVNPDGHEWKRAKWPWIIKKYWKYSERLMIKYSDCVVCDSQNIERYIVEEYGDVKTTFISYGSDLIPSALEDDDPKFKGWLDKNELVKGSYYLIVGRFVPENNYETMIREFMNSKSERKLVIITNVNQRYMESLNRKLQLFEDSRICFVGTVYDDELLKKIRENAFGYLHGHEVGGTNPSLLEALGYTELNLLLDVGFNREVAQDAAMYWTKKENHLASLINEVDGMNDSDRKKFGDLAKSRIKENYSWELIGIKYKNLWGISN